MSLTRRVFLRQLSAAGIVSIGTLPPQFLCRAALAGRDNGASNGGRILVLVELEGGNDGLNTVIPYGDPEYYRARPGIGISEDVVLKIDDYHGLHPQLAGLKDLYDQGMLAIVQGVGYPNPDRSHFRSMDIWHSAQPETESIDRGWLGRALDMEAERAEAATSALVLGMERLPLALVASHVTVPTILDLASYRLRVGGGSAPVQRTRRQLVHQLAEASGPAGTDLDFLRRTARTAYQSEERLRQVTGSYQAAAEYPASALASRLKLIAQMIAGDFPVHIFFVSIGGFDTHAQQLGAHQALLEELASAVRAFYFDLKGHGLHDRVCVATFSEFGRRIKENGSLGTDHGAASQMFVVVPEKGGLYGPHPSLTDVEEGDLKFHTDFRSVYATLLEKWLKIPAQPVLGRGFEPLDFV